jgi:DNA-binding IclR family transcriptional regulator
MSERAKSGSANQSVARALKILNLLADNGEPLGVREIARKLRVAPSIAQRLLKTLAREGYLEQADTTLRYGIGYRAFQVGNSFVAQTNLHSAVTPELYVLAEQQISSFLGVLRDKRVVYLASVPSNGPVAVNHRPGAHAHLHSTAMGKALLAELPDQELRALLANTSLPRFTPHTKTSVTQLIADLQAIRNLGYSVSDQENRMGFYSVGAVVRDAAGSAIAVISGAIPTPELKSQDRPRLAKLVVEAARRASRRLGAPNLLRPQRFAEGQSPHRVGSPSRVSAKRPRRRLARGG